MFFLSNKKKANKVIGQTLSRQLLGLIAHGLCFLSHKVFFFQSSVYQIYTDNLLVLPIAVHNCFAVDVDVALAVVANFQSFTF